MKTLAIAGALALAALTLGGCSATLSDAAASYGKLSQCEQIALPAGAVAGALVVGVPGVVIGPIAGELGCHAFGQVN